MVYRATRALVDAAIAAAAVLASAAAAAQAAPVHPPLLRPADAAAIAGEVSGTAARRTIQSLSQHHRIRGSEGYRAAAEIVRDRLVGAGLADAEILSLPADGRIFYGTQRSRPAWNARFAELWEQRKIGEGWADDVRIASWGDQPTALAQDSFGGKAEADLVDVGAGTAESDYRGKNVRGKLVLASAQPGAVVPLAVGRYGAAGIVSYAQNQKQAWWGDDETLIRWGHLETFEPARTFAFMVSPARARGWQERMARGGTVRLRAAVDAGQTPGAYLIPTAVIRGRDEDQEIVLSCHLDHQAPGANDNASGCSGALEVARSLSKLIAERKLPKPRRSIRFVWPPEIEGTIALLNARPEFARRTLATIHLDMIGGNTEVTKSVLRVHGSPPSLPTFVNDVGVALGRFVNAQSLAFADGGSADFALVDPEGDKRALQAVVGGFNVGSDHQVWAEGSWRIPVIYLADWPDRYIHTQKDSVANIDPTKLRRAVFIAAASAWYLANLGDDEIPGLWPLMRGQSLQRAAATLARADTLRSAGVDDGEIDKLWRFHFDYEASVVASVERFARVPDAYRDEARRQAASLRGLVAPSASSAEPSGIARGAGPVYGRAATPKGPMNGFGYSYLDDRLTRTGTRRPRLLDHPGTDTCPDVPYEALNLVDGKRDVERLRDDLAAICGPIPAADVAEFLGVLHRLRILETGRR